jgi:CheY-like chemotaxis protein/anti-sigma regulatory factor (Ser/Thr protein kinase)
VLTNLLGNAVKFTETGQVGVSAVVIGETAGDVTLQISMTDTGIGIAKPRQEAIFESFIQADGSTTRRYGGTGLGLTISRQIISLMEGQIKVESEPGQGSKFTLELTLPKGDERLAERPVNYEGLKGVRILIADDNAVNCQILSEQISAWGCRVHTVSLGTEAIAALESEAVSAASDPFKAVLLDLQMPEMDGIEAARRIRRQVSGGGVPLILLSSGFAGDCSHEEMTSLFDLVLSKPVRQSALQDAILRLTVRPGRKSAAKQLSGEPMEEGEVTMTGVQEAGPEGIRVLLAEDNPVNQKVAAHLLKKWNTDVTVVNNGREAMDAAVAQAKKGTGFDMVFMDVQMPEMDGLTATANLRSRNVLSPDGTRRLPIIALTAHSMQGDRERCLASGMDDYLSKPINEADLRAVLVRWRPVAEDAVVPSGVIAIPSGDESSIDDEGRLIVRRERLWECCGGDAELVAEVVEEFLQSVPEVLARLEKAIAGADAPKVRFEAHTLRGSCRTVGADSLEFTCGLLEEGGAAGNLGAAPELLKRARTAAERLVPDLNRAATETETAV